MDIVYIILVTLFGLVCLGLLIYQVKENKRENVQNENEIEELEAELVQLNDKNRTLARNHDMMAVEVKLTAEDKNKLESELKLLQEELFQLQSSIQVEAVRSDSKESLEAELENLKALAVEKMSELQQITANTQKLAATQNEKLEEIAKLEAGMKALEGRIASGREVLESIESQIVATNNQLTELNVLKGAVLAVESGEGSVWEFKVPSDKSRLVELIHQLVDEYGNAFPILRKELLKAE
jgi:chromosome segregation ATPase